MDSSVIETLRGAGIDPRFEEGAMLQIGFELNEKKKIRPVGERVLVEAGKATAFVPLKPISQLFTGDRVPPSFKEGPTDDYLFFFLLLERTAVFYCKVTKPEYDQEMERLYSFLRRRPDGTDKNPLFSYLQAAARLYMSLHDVSRAEFEAVVQRLSRSARRFSAGAASTNYLRIVSANMA